MVLGAQRRIKLNDKSENLSTRTSKQMSGYYLAYAMCQALLQAGNITLNKTNKNPYLHKTGILIRK